MRLSKLQWQRESRNRFKLEHGYSDAAHYATAGLRIKVLIRDGFKCVRCGMTDDEHKQKWNRPITVDHIDKNRKNNCMENLQTLCLVCHGSKDIIPRLREQRVPAHKEEILARRSNGESYQFIADSLGFSIAAIWNWVRKWEEAA